MDIYRIIGQLVHERDRLEKLIQSLEERKLSAKAPPVAPKRHRGRKSMDSAARTEVSARMKRYWEQRRLENPPQNADNV